MSRFPSLSLQLRFCQIKPLMDSCPVPRFLKFATVNMPLLFSHLNFFPNLYMEWILCQIRPFREICHFRKTYNYQHASFVILLTFLPNVYKYLPNLSFVKMPLFVISFVFGQTLELSIFAEIWRFRLNLPFSYNCHLSSFPSLSPHLSFCQTFDGFLPNPPFSQFDNFVKSPTVNIAGLHLTSRRLCWWSRTKTFVSSVNQTLFSC